MTTTKTSLQWEALAEASLTSDRERFTRETEILALARRARHRKPNSPKWRGVARYAARVCGGLFVAAITVAGIASAAVVPPAYPGIPPSLVALQAQTMAYAVQAHRGPVVTFAHRTVSDPGTLTVHVKVPGCVVDPEVDVGTAASTGDSPGPAEWASHHGKVRAGHSFTVRIHLTPSWDPPGQWHVWLISGYSCTSWNGTVRWNVNARFRVKA